VNMAANDPTAQNVLNAQPLFFRSLDEHFQEAQPALDRAVLADPLEACDFEASLRAAHEQGRQWLPRSRI
jgi:hypothetical protein